MTHQHGQPLSSFYTDSYAFFLLLLIGFCFLSLRAQRAAKPSQSWKLKAFTEFSSKSVMCPCIIDEEYRVGWLWNIGQRRCAWSNPRLHSSEALTCHCLLLQHPQLGSHSMRIFIQTAPPKFWRLNQNLSSEKSQISHAHKQSLRRIFVGLHPVLAKQEKCYHCANAKNLIEY